MIGALATLLVTCLIVAHAWATSPMLTWSERLMQAGVIFIGVGVMWTMLTMEYQTWPWRRVKADDMPGLRQCVMCGAVAEATDRAIACACGSTVFTQPPRGWHPSDEDIREVFSKGRIDPGEITQPAIDRGR